MLKYQFFDISIQRGLGRVTVRVLGPKKLSRLQRRLRPIRPGKKQRWLPYLFKRSDWSVASLDSLEMSRDVIYVIYTS